MNWFVPNEIPYKYFHLVDKNKCFHYLIVPVNSIGSWGIIDSLCLSVVMGIFAISCPSMIILPEIRREDLK